MSCEKELEAAELRGAEWAFRFSLAHLQRLLPADAYEKMIKDSAEAVVVMYKYRREGR